VWPPAPPSRSPAPWTRVKGLKAAPPPQLVLGGRRRRGDAGCVTLMGRSFWSLPRSARGPQAGPRRQAPRPTAHRGVSVLRSRCHHHHRSHRHRHHHRSRRHHHHLGVISPRAPAAATTTAARVAISLPGSLEGLGPQVSVSPPSLSLIVMSTSLNPSSVFRASSPSAPKVTPPPPVSRPIDGSGSQQQASARSGARDPPLAAAKTTPAASHAPARGPAAAAPTSGGVAATEEAPVGGSVPPPDAGATQEAHPAPTLRLLRRRWRWCSGGASGQVPSKKQRQSRSLACCPLPTRSLVTLGRQSCGSGRR
jgi:hypothetical protein